jgi:hypothetical protein
MNIKLHLIKRVIDVKKTKVKLQAFIFPMELMLVATFLLKPQVLQDLWETVYGMVTAVPCAF